MLLAGWVQLGRSKDTLSDYLWARYWGVYWSWSKTVKLEPASSSSRGG